MLTHQQALEAVADYADQLESLQLDVQLNRDNLGGACRDAHELGISDRELAGLTPYSRARIQQFRTMKVAV